MCFISARIAFERSRLERAARRFLHRCHGNHGRGLRWDRHRTVKFSASHKGGRPDFVHSLLRVRQPSIGEAVLIQRIGKDRGEPYCGHFRVRNTSKILSASPRAHEEAVPVAAGQSSSHETEEKSKPRPFQKRSCEKNPLHGFRLLWLSKISQLEALHAIYEAPRYILLHRQNSRLGIFTASGYVWEFCFRRTQFLSV